MVSSMTGFGVGEAHGDGHVVTVELKSVNHRFCEVKTRIPRMYAGFEERINRKIKEKFSRGHFDVFVSYREEEGSSRNLSVDKGLALSYYSALEALAGELGIPNSATVVDVANFPEVLSISDEEQDMEARWLLTKIALYDAIRALQSMRSDEGLNLKKDILKRLEIIRDLSAQVAGQARENTLEYRTKLMDRISGLLADIPVNEERIAQEVALFADRSDITEETVRLGSHLNQMYDILEESEPVGRKLDFLVQEMNREINTIGSKSNCVSISQRVVEIKSELEKIREQVQNIE